MSHRAPARRIVLLAFIVTALGIPIPALADDDVRVSGTCGAGASAELRLRAEDGHIRVRFEVDSRRAGERWRIVLVHERRVVWRGRRRTTSGGHLRVRRDLSNYAGADYISVRAARPRGNSCSAGATLTS